ncbi:efflux RND transporter periplasmic adaptor subunit [Hymenobacter aerilatus]|uniref:Efflux RND transporter periplasmic adaptor subunit n=1 Tax=Hymenobacter aerilatus TaxID=2932251 RepID=A0A8T9SXL7_9BACT|nr:efflux RND transporter periplasmic adaptor subunit [Hymenobacter aerilatus]UOR06962.1 efflux RND transporter periplasmic adaptor subunit [Hymenobacter aerilatus]
MLGWLLLTSACGTKKDVAAEAAGAAAATVAPAYPVLTPTPTTAQLHTDYPTVLEGQANVEIRPKLDGFIDQVFVDEGARVRKGQPLFRLNNDEADQQVRAAEAALLSARADVAAAQLDVEKTRPLVEQQILSDLQLKAYQATLQARQGALAQARATLLNARKTQSYAHIISPVDGVIGSLPYKQGSLVKAYGLELLAFAPVMSLPGRVAHVVAHSVFARLSIGSLLGKAFRPGDSYKTFDEEAEALHWLLH